MKNIAITTDGSGIVSLVKSVNEQEEKKLINEQAKRLAERERLAKEHENQHERVDKAISHFTTLELVLAKNTYDNLVDRGELEENELFQKAWIDYIFSKDYDTETLLANAPKEFTSILEKIGGAGYEKE